MTNMPPPGNVSDPPRCLNGRGSIAFAAHPGQCAAARSRLRQWHADRRLFYRTGVSGHRRRWCSGDDRALPAAFSAAGVAKMDMRQLDLATKFDGLLAWDSFFHLARDDQRRMFTLFRRHARPQAALMFTSGPADGVAIGASRPAAVSRQPGAGGVQTFIAGERLPRGRPCGGRSRLRGRTVWLAQLFSDNVTGRFPRTRP